MLEDEVTADVVTAELEDVLGVEEVLEEEVTAELEDALGVEVRHEAPDMVYFWSEGSYSRLGSG